jgi:hypothetical protein
MMDRSLDSLSSDFKPLAIEVLARLVERHICVLIVQTSRTLAEHKINLANGTSSTLRSKHLPRSMRGFETGTADDHKADAIDLCPFDEYQLHGPDKLMWNAADPAWVEIGDVGEMLGLRWGGRWKNPHDPGHLEYVFPVNGFLGRHAEG